MSDPRTRLPPLNALRAFEAAARHRNLTRAAKELNVTQAAVSYQVKALEDYLGVQLFQRSRSGLLLTSEAEDYFSALHHVFRSIRDATERVTSSPKVMNLTLSTLPNFAIHWLVPRLPGFTSRYPDIDVNVVTFVRTLEFDRNQMDVAVRWGLGWPELDCTYLFSAQLTPVCSPHYLSQNGPLTTPRDLIHHTLLHVQSAMEDWPNWFAASGIETVDTLRGSKFDTVALALEAACESAGLAMGRLPLAADALSSGRLVAPFKQRYQPAKAWYLVCPRSSSNFRKITLFKSWMLEEAQKCDLHFETLEQHFGRVGLHMQT